MVLISPVTEMAVGDIAASDAIFAASKGSLGDVSFFIYQHAVYKVVGSSRGRCCILWKTKGF